ncbi:laminin subunit alpha-5-like [Gopherus flavomarginatus]|uniref:laminin subunit alpha-5-like n=1 Tax=Gopherus flavomarginatus TaxID=286002 RepID=UPI0021CBB45D|nr:laminin subunit alpha-5-like [Gopherus flavomarginatus]
MPRLCPPGTFSNLLGQSMASECQLCPSGFYCEGSGLSDPSGECWEGYYCDSSQGPVSDFTLYPCPQGFYCPPGTHQGTQYSCPPGTFGPRQKLKSIQECQRCPLGKYCEFPGLSTPTGDCAEGFWCKGGARVRDPMDGVTGLPCPPGHYCLAGTPTPSLCPHGTWSSNEGNKNLWGCQPCPGGHYCNSTGLVAPSGHCSPGFYCIAGARTPTPTDGLSGAPCPMGHSCPLGTKNPILCSPGTYMPQTHGEECYTCPEGKYCVPPQKPQFCPKGFFCPKETGLDWQPCPPGTYSPEQGLESSTGCRACDGGKYCLYRQAGPCPPGHYCPKGTAVPKHCPVGTFSTRIKLSSEDIFAPGAHPFHWLVQQGHITLYKGKPAAFSVLEGSSVLRIPLLLLGVNVQLAITAPLVQLQRLNTHAPGGLTTHRSAAVMFLTVSLVIQGISAMELDSYLLLVSVKLGSIAPEELFLLDLP